MKYPIMSSEVMEAIHLMFEDNPDIEVDCYLYLEGIATDVAEVHRLGNLAANALENMGRCPNCGHMKETCVYYEVHNELPERPKERMTDTYCPVCDIPGQEKIE